MFIFFVFHRQRYYSQERCWNQTYLEKYEEIHECSLGLISNATKSEEKRYSYVGNSTFQLVDALLDDNLSSLKFGAHRQSLFFNGLSARLGGTP